MRLATILGLVIFVAGSQTLNAADNWPQWRGPLGTGVATEGEYPDSLSAEENLLWKVKLPGRGSSTPAVWGSQIFVTCGTGGEDGLVCYGMDGEEQWTKIFGKERAGKHQNGTGSNPSPVTDGQHVVAYYKSGTIVCLRPNGRELWRKNLQENYGKDTLWWDLGTSPVLAGDKVIVAVMQGGDSYLAALDLASGDEVWKADRNYKTTIESDHAYTTPQVVKLDGKEVVVTWGADHLTGHDAATGKLLWECGGFNPDDEPNWRVIASQTVADGIAVVPYGRGSFVAGVRLGGQGDITKSNRIWEKDELGSDVPTPVAYDGKVILVTDRGQIVCRDLKSGEEHWTGELPRNRNKYYASPVLASDKLILAREDGMVFVGQVGDDGFQLLSTNELGERVIATPVPVQNSVLVRGDEYLYRFGSDQSVATTGG